MRIHTHTQVNSSTHQWSSAKRQMDNLTSRETHMQACRHTGRQVDRQLEADRQEGMLAIRSGTQCPQAARDIAAPLNSIMTVSSTSHGPADVKIYS